MIKLDQHKHWWVAVVAASVIGIAALLIADQWMPGYQPLAAFLFFALLGGSFCWAYYIEQEHLWWAIIPGLGLLTLCAVMLTNTFIGMDATNDWLNVLVMGIGAAIIAAVLSHRNARQTLIIVSMFIFIVGFAMSPFTTTLKIILIAVDVLAAAFFLWRGQTPKSE